MGYEFHKGKGVLLPVDLKTRQVALEADAQKAAIVEEIKRIYSLNKKLPHTVDVLAFFLAFYRAAKVETAKVDKLNFAIRKEMEKLLCFELQSPSHKLNLLTPQQVLEKLIEYRRTVPAKLREDEWQRSNDYRPEQKKKSAGVFLLRKIKGKWHVLLGAGKNQQDSESREWTVPLGGIDPGETAQDAAIRELKEEAGIELSSKFLVDVGDSIEKTRDGRLTLMRFYIAIDNQDSEKVPRGISLDEFSQPRWVPLEVILSAPDGGAIQALVNYLGGPLRNGLDEGRGFAEFSTFIRSVFDFRPPGSSASSEMRMKDEIIGPHRVVSAIFPAGTVRMRLRVAKPEVNNRIRIVWSDFFNSTIIDGTGQIRTDFFPKLIAETAQSSFSGLKALTPDGMPLHSLIRVPYGNLFCNDGFVAYQDEVLYQGYQELLGERDYPGLVQFSDGGIRLATLRYRRDTHGKVRIFDAQGNEEISAVTTAIFGQPLIENGTVAPVPKLIKYFSDIGHIFQLPQIPLQTGGFSVAQAGRSSLVKGRFQNDSLAVRAYDGPVTVEIPEQARPDFKSAMEGRQKLEAVNLEKFTARVAGQTFSFNDATGNFAVANYEEKKTTEEVKKPGDFYFDRATRMLTIYYPRSLYYHNFLGLRKNEKGIQELVSIVTRPVEDKGGMTLEQWGSFLREKFRLDAAVVLANGGDMMMDMYEKPYLVSFKQRTGMTAAINIVSDANPAQITATQLDDIPKGGASARSEIRDERARSEVRSELRQDVGAKVLPKVNSDVIVRWVQQNTSPAMVFVDAEDWGSLSEAQKQECFFVALSRAETRFVVYNERGQVRDLELAAFLKLSRVTRTDRTLDHAVEIYSRSNVPSIQLSKNILPSAEQIDALREKIVFFKTTSDKSGTLATALLWAISDSAEVRFQGVREEDGFWTVDDTLLEAIQQEYTDSIVVTIAA